MTTTENLPTSALVDTLVGNYQGNTRKISIDNLAAQMNSGAGGEALAGWPLVIFVSGQSNAAGRPSGYNWQVPANLWMWSYAGSGLSDASATTTIGTFETGAALNGFGNWGMFIGARAAREYPDRPVFVINISKGGCAIAQWEVAAPNPNMWTAIQNNLPAAFAEIQSITGKPVNRIDAAYWWQGESDLGNPDLPDDLDSVIARLRTLSWYQTGTPILISGFSPFWSADLSVLNKHMKRVVARDPQRRRFINTSLLPQGHWDPADNYIHMTASGYFNASQLAWDSFANGAGEMVGGNFQYDGDDTGNFMFGDAIPAIGYYAAFRRDQPGDTALCIWNESADATARARLLVRVGTNASDLQCYPELTATRLTSTFNRWEFVSGGTLIGRFDEPTTDLQTGLLLRKRTDGAVTSQRVTLGASDSAGSGYRVLRVPN
ncbi:MAG: sialate O-acetylesterase [Paracoccus sp. (in: a-proteobacteria)]